MKTATSLDGIFGKATKTYGVSEKLLRAVAQAESGLNPSAVSKCGAQGIMQLMPKTANALGVTDPLKTEQNTSIQAQTQIKSQTESAPAFMGRYNVNANSLGYIPNWYESFDPAKIDEETANILLNLFALENL